MRKLLLFIPVFAVIMLAGCGKKTETLDFGKLDDYSLQVVGKQITYKIDSLLFINFGTKDTVISYQAKDSVVAQITDNLGRTAYRIFHFIRKNSTDPWVNNNTFQVTPTTNTIEFLENNHRFVKLKQPMRDGYSWKGNTYLDTYSLTSDIKYMDDWDYTYENMDASIMLGTLKVDNTISVNERDEIIGNINDPNSYSEKNISIEKYAKGIGLVYRNFLHQEYQPPTPGHGGYKVGYGVTVTMVSHN